MAREYARVKLTIWTDPDFHSLTGDAQRLYFVLLTNGSLKLCGVTDWREARLSALCSDWDIPTIRNAALELGNADLIAIDPNTEEVLVRSFVRHDGVLKSPNITRAMVKDYGTIASHKLRALVSREVRRGFRENPDWKGNYKVRFSPVRGNTTVIFSPSCSGNILTIGRPREPREPCGTSQTLSQ